MTILQRFWRKPRTFAVRNWLFQIHLYSGLIAGLYALVIGITGSALVFQPQMRAWIDRDLTRVTGSGQRISVDQVLASVRSAYPGFHVMSVRIPSDAQETFRVSASHMGGDEFYVHPFTGAILGEGHRSKDFLSWLQDLHFNLLGGQTGRIVNGIGGLTMLLLSLTGLVIWWPGKAHVKRAISINWKARWKRINYDIHSSIGIITILFTVVISLTGAYYAWPEQSRQLVAHFSPVRSKATPKLPMRRAGRNLPLSRLVEIAQQAVPGTRVTVVLFSHSPGQPVKFTLMPGDARQYQNSDYVYIDPYTGKVLRLDTVEGRSLGDAILAWVPPLHFGTFGGGTPVYILWLVLGLCPAVLGVSGVLMWWNRVLVKKLRRWNAAKSLDGLPAVEEAAQVEIGS